LRDHDPIAYTPAEAGWPAGTRPPAPGELPAPATAPDKRRQERVVGVIDVDRHPLPQAAFLLAGQPRRPLGHNPQLREPLTHLRRGIGQQHGPGATRAVVVDHQEVLPHSLIILTSQPARQAGQRPTHLHRPGGCQAAPAGWLPGPNATHGKPHPSQLRRHLPHHRTAKPNG
jgi:hypothetical protein